MNRVHTTMRRNNSFNSILFFIVTFAFLDRMLESMMKPFLHRKRDMFIRYAMEEFQLISTDAEENIKLNNNLNDEADRVYAIVDRSILRERIIRAKYTFLATIAAAIILIGTMGGFTGGTITPFISPLAMAGVAWITSIITIPISYQQRVKGAMDSVIIRQKNLLAKSTLSSNALIRKKLPANDFAARYSDNAEQDTLMTSTLTTFHQLDSTLSNMEEGRASSSMPMLSSMKLAL